MKTAVFWTKKKFIQKTWYLLFLKESKTEDSRINAYITIAKDTALKQAETADEKMAFQSEYR